LVASQETKHIALRDCAPREGTLRAVYDSRYEHHSKTSREVAVVQATIGERRPTPPYSAKGRVADHPSRIELEVRQ